MAPRPGGSPLASAAWDGLAAGNGIRQSRPRFRRPPTPLPSSPPSRGDATARSCCGRGNPGPCGYCSPCIGINLVCQRKLAGARPAPPGRHPRTAGASILCSGVSRRAASTGKQRDRHETVQQGGQEAGRPGGLGQGMPRRKIHDHADLHGGGNKGIARRRQIDPGGTWTREPSNRHPTGAGRSRPDHAGAAPPPVPGGVVPEDADQGTDCVRGHVELLIPPCSVLRITTRPTGRGTFRPGGPGCAP